MRLRSTARGFMRRAASCAVLVAMSAAGPLSRMLAIGRRDSMAGAVSTILVIRLDLMGDVVLSMPAVARLRRCYPEAQIVMLTLPYTAELAQIYDCVDQVIALDTNLVRTPSGLFDVNTWKSYRSTFRIVRARQFDICLSLSGRTASLCAFLSGARCTIGYGGEAYPFSLSHPVKGKRYRWRMHEVEYGHVLAVMAGSAETGVTPRPQVPRGAQETATKLLAAHGVEFGDSVVAIHLGSGNGSAKRWPASHWAEFAVAARRRFNSAVVIVGGASDGVLAAEILARVEFPVVSLIGQTTLPELAAVLARANLVVSGDSGPLHLAVALSTPSIGIYGPTDPLVYGPHHGIGPVMTLRHDLPCSPCYNATRSAECPLGDPICMRLVSVPRVLAAAEAIFYSE